MRLLPPNQDLGWTPYAWLIYLGVFWMGAVLSGPDPRTWALTALGTAVFLVLYFWGYWLPGRKALWASAGITLLGILFAPINWGSSVFFVYAGAYLGFSGPPGFAFRLLLLLAAIPPVLAWFLDLPGYFWIPGVVFTLLVGGINIHYAGVRRSQAALRRTQEEVERLAAMAERERIARDLHDLLGHTLTVITRKAELAKKLAESDPPRAAREIAEVEEVARKALKEVRHAVTGFRLTDLATELAQARVALQSAAIHFEADVSEVALDEDREHVLALALREAATNVLRHSGATSCRVTLQEKNGVLRLSVRDNGIGGDATAGSGLSGMWERVTALGGTVDRQVQGGTTLVVSLPTGRAADALQPKASRKRNSGRYPAGCAVPSEAET